MKRGLLLYLTLLALAAGAIHWYWRIAEKSPVVAPEGNLQDLPSLSSVDVRPIRVNLTSKPRREFEVTVAGGFTLQTIDDGRVLHRGDELEGVFVESTSDGIRVDGSDYEVPQLELVPDSPPAIWIGDHQYRGTIRFHRASNERMTAVNVVALDEYLASVVDSEMPLEFGRAARQAQAVVARTYVLYQAQRAPRAARFDVYATTRSQKYLGFQYRDRRGRRLAGESEDSRQIVRDTAGVVCTHQGDLFCTYYCAACGGRTVQGDEIFADAASPLQSVECEWCAPAPLSAWRKEISKADVARHLSRLFNSRDKPFGQLASIRADAATSIGSEARFTVTDGTHRYRLSATQLRAHLPSVGLPSSRFSISEHKDGLVFEGRGHGHGVGLCQWGARGLARAGRTATEILEHYYPGVELRRLPSEEDLPSAARVGPSPTL